MGSATPLIVSVSVPGYGRVVVETSDGRRHHVDLAPVFSTVHCFPKDAAAWATVTPDAAGLALVWTTRFEVHVDQVLVLAERVEPTLRSA
jgi:hypothetical protein